MAENKCVTGVIALLTTGRGPPCITNNQPGFLNIQPDVRRAWLIQTNNQSVFFFPFLTPGSGSKVEDSRTPPDARRARLRRKTSLFYMGGESLTNSTGEINNIPETYYYLGWFNPRIGLILYTWIVQGFYLFLQLRSPKGLHLFSTSLPYWTLNTGNSKSPWHEPVGFFFFAGLAREDPWKWS